MAAIDDLLARITDLALKADLDREFKSLRTDREFGLVFERHLPENVRLPGHPIRRGLIVEERGNAESERWVVANVKSGVAKLRRRNDEGAVVEETRPVDELVVIRDMGNPIHPGLKSIGRIERGGDKPHHSVINGENFHVLEMLLYTCAGQVDCIYSLNNLAEVHRYQRRFAEAFQLHKRALAIREEALGPEHPDVAQSVNNLALLYHDQGKYAEAEPLYKRALAILEKALGPEHPAVATALENYSELLRATGQLIEAEKASRRAKAIRDNL